MIFSKNIKIKCLPNLAIMFLFGLLLIFSISIITSASIPYPSYTYNYWGEAVPAPQAYTPLKVIDTNQLGAGQTDNPRDFFVGLNNIYLVDTNNNRILVMTKNWELKNIISQFNDKNRDDKFNKPESIFVNEKGQKYIADTGNRRIIVLDSKNNFLKEITAPESDFQGIIPDDFTFRPENVVVGSLGNIYVTCKNVYEGILEFDDEGFFQGFLGAPRVTPSPADFFWRQFATEAQRERMSLFLPAEYNALDNDDKGFIFAIENDIIRRLSPTGENVLRTEGFWEPQGDLAQLGLELETHFIDIVARNSGMYSVLDANKGRIFTYDKNSKLLYIFGGIGYRDGLFLEPVALDCIDDKIVVLDRRGEKLTIFNPTDYATYIHNAISYYNQGRYKQTKSMWEKVLFLNSNYELAYSGIGNTYLRGEVNLRKAMFNYKMGNNRSGYSSAFKKYRQILLREKFNFIMSFLVFIIILIYIVIKFKLLSKLLSCFQTVERKYVAVNINNYQTKYQEYKIRIRDKLRNIYYSLYIIFHPFDGFWDLKHEKKAKLFPASVIFVLLSWTYFFMKYYTGFIFNYQDIAQQNVLMDFASLIIPFLLWCMINWALTTLMEGKGTFKDIFIATSYSLVPIILINIPLTIISHHLVQEEATFFYLLQSSSFLWAAGLIFIGTMVTHEYSILKTVLTCIAIIIGIGTFLFISLLFFSLLDLIGVFLWNIYIELIQILN